MFLLLFSMRSRIFVSLCGNILSKVLVGMARWILNLEDMNREWTTLKEYEDILFEFYNGIARITINRPQVRNAFTPRTVSEMSDALYICRERRDVRVVVLTGAGDKAFCSGGDMHVKGHGGYVGDDGVPRLNVLEVQRQIRSLPKPVIAAVNGFAIGGGHVLHDVDLTPSETAQVQMFTAPGTLFYSDAASCQGDYVEDWVFNGPTDPTYDDVQDFFADYQADLEDYIADYYD